MKPKPPATVDAFLAELDADRATVVAGLRRLALAAGPGVTEHIKWNAPSFCWDNDDRLTLGLERTGGIRLVLHRGAKPKDASGFVFADAAGLAKWPAPDRGVVVVKDAADFAARSAAIEELVGRWFKATR